MCVEVAGQVSGQDDAPVERDRRCHGAHHVEDRGCAVRRERVVEPRACGQIVCLLDVFNEQRTRARWRGPEPIELDLLVAHLAQGHQVALIGSDVYQLVRLEKARERRVLIILRPSQLDREIPRGVDYSLVRAKKLPRAAECLVYSLTPSGGFGGKPPQKSGFRRHLAGSKMPKEGSKMPKETIEIPNPGTDL